MKKIISMLCCITLMFALAVTPAFAADNETNIATEESVITRATSKGLFYREKWFFQGTQTCSVNPDSGANLNVWLNNSNTVVLTVYKKGLFVNHEKYRQTFGAGERDVKTVSNCSGTYIVQLTSAIDGSTVSVLVYQN